MPVTSVQRSSASVILSVCPHDKTKTAEITITELGIEIVHHDNSPTHKLILGQKVKGHKVQKHTEGSTNKTA